MHLDMMMMMRDQPKPSETSKGSWGAKCKNTRKPQPVQRLTKDFSSFPITDL